MSSGLKIRLCGIATALLMSSIGAHAAQIVWERNIATEKPGKLKPGAALVPMESGNVLKLSYDAKEKNQPIGWAAGIEACGPSTLRLWLEGESLRQIGNDLMFSLVMTNEATNESFQADGIVCGARINKNGFRELPIPIQLADKPAKYKLSLVAEWPDHGARKPVVYLKRAVLESADSTHPYISYVWKSKTIYAPMTPIIMKVTVVNPTSQVFDGSISMLQHSGLDDSSKVKTAEVKCDGNSSKIIEIAWDAGKAKGGCRVEACLLDKTGAELNRFEKDFGIESDPRNLSFSVKDLEIGRRPNIDGLFYVSPASYSQSRDIIGKMRQGLGGRKEFFAWSWCDLAQFISPEDPYLRHCDKSCWVSLKKFKDQVALFNDAGIYPISYILGRAVGIAGYQLMQQHPDWFIYTREGEIDYYDMALLNNYATRNSFGFKSKDGFMLWAILDATNPEVRRWIANQIISLGTEMGFKGVRWDVWNMSVKTDYYRMDGTQVAKTTADADRLTAESIRAVKEMVAQKLPEFTYGYNYASPGENADTPLTLAEKCRGHGWLLDEASIGYHGKTSPFHTWDAYAKIMIEWGNKVRQLGGIYNPWPFSRGNMSDNNDIDWLQESIYHLLSGGRVWFGVGGYAKNNSALYGDFSLLAFRYNNIYSGWDLRLQPENQTNIRVKAPDTVWWKRFVFTNKSLDGKDQDIVHLVNSPPILDAEENPDSKVRPPTGPVEVICAGRNGQKPVKAWLVMAESLTPDAEPKVQALPLELKNKDGGVSVTVSSLLYFKTVVFEY